MNTNNLPQTNTHPTGSSRYTNTTFLKTSANYMVQALGEGIKQSLNGMDINVEFLTLTARSVVQTSGKAVKKLITKYTAAGREFTGGRFHYNNNTTLSHS